MRRARLRTGPFHPQWLKWLAYGAPVDPRLLTAFRKQIDVFNKGLALSNFPVEPMRIPLDNAFMPAYLVPALGMEHDIRPLIILTNGYDATVTDMYFASAVAVAVAASRRDYHCLIFDGPGQGEMLYEQGIPLRADWDTVITAVVDFSVQLATVDPERIVLSGWSLGGHLAPRAASGEHRLAACIADPGLWSITGQFRDFANKLGATAMNLSSLDQPTLNRVEQAVSANPGLRWKIVQRGFWVHGVDNMRDYLRSAEQFTILFHFKSLAASSAAQDCHGPASDMGKAGKPIQATRRFLRRHTMAIVSARYSEAMAVPHQYPVTPDGRYFVVAGRLWRMSNPALPAEKRQELVERLMNARRQVAAAMKTRNAEAERSARAAVDEAKRLLGERGPVWWTDGAPDFNRRLVANTPYADWHATLPPSALS